MPCGGGLALSGVLCHPSSLGPLPATPGAVKGPACLLNHLPSPAISALVACAFVDSAAQNRPPRPAGLTSLQGILHFQSCSKCAAPPPHFLICRRLPNPHSALPAPSPSLLFPILLNTTHSSHLLTLAQNHKTSLFSATHISPHIFSSSQLPQVLAICKVRDLHCIQSSSPTAPTCTEILSAALHPFLTQQHYRHCEPPPRATFQIPCGPRGRQHWPSRPPIDRANLTHHNLRLRRRFYAHSPATPVPAVPSCTISIIPVSARRQRTSRQLFFRLR